MSATIRDVARASGVHASTVSRAFSTPHMVNSDTRSRVLATAEQLGYRPNRVARALITGRTHNLGLIVADIANPFFPPLIKASESYARQRDYHLFIADSGEDAAVEEKLVRALSKQVDGLLLCSPRMSNTVIERMRVEVPLVVINRVVAGTPSVVMDVGQGAREAIEHLIALGHRDIALLAGPRGSWTNREIRRAVGAVSRAGGVRLSVLGPNPPTEGAGAMAALPVRRLGVTAVLTYNDLMAIGLIDGLLSHGVRVPDDISVIGIDDVGLSRMIRPRLTTVATPTAAAGRAAIDMLLQQGDGRRAKPAGADLAARSWATPQVTLHTALIVRDSTGPGPYHSTSTDTSRPHSRSARHVNLA